MSLYKYFSRSELLKGREVQYPLSEEQESNLVKLLTAINPIREAWGGPLSVSSCYRPAAINDKVVGAAKASAHTMCQAIDIVDKDGKLAEWSLHNLTLLGECGIFMEDPRYTIVLNKDGTRYSGWVHYDIRGPKSGKRVFIPYAGPIKLQVRD